MVLVAGYRSRFNMSSQPLLTGAFLSQRLVAAVEEVMELARATVIQYEQESTQIRRENQLLRSKLGEVTAGLPPEANGTFFPRPRNQLNLHIVSRSNASR